MTSKREEDFLLAVQGRGPTYGRVRSPKVGRFMFDRSIAAFRGRRRCSSSTAIAGLVLFIVLGGTAVAARGLIRAGDIATGAITSRQIKDGSVIPADINARTMDLMQIPGATGATGETGSMGGTGSTGAPGANGLNGLSGGNGANGPGGLNGTNGTDGVAGVNGTDGTDGTIAPLSAVGGPTPLPTGSPPVVVVSRTVPAGNYVVLAKTQLSHTGAGDSIHCNLKSGAVIVDQVDVKTLPALAAVPVSLQAVATTSSPSVLSLECKVLVADGAANFSSLIAVPTA
jgi:hypothetical protein